MLRSSLGYPVLVLLLVTLLSSTLEALALPSFTWTGQWQVTLNCIEFPGPAVGNIPLPCDGTAGVAAAFGASARAGQILDTDSERVFAQAASARNTPGVGNSYVGGVSFSREFTLTGSPEGWIVGVQGQLNGALHAISSSASGGANAFIVDPRFPGSLALNRFFEQVGVFSGSTDMNVSLTQLTTAMLTDGTYQIGGNTSAIGSLGINRLPGVYGQSFFGQNLAGGHPGFGFQVEVTAAPVPEPSTIILVAPIILAIALCRKFINASRHWN